MPMIPDGYIIDPNMASPRGREEVTGVDRPGGCTIDLFFFLSLLFAFAPPLYLPSYPSLLALQSEVRGRGGG